MEVLVLIEAVVIALLAVLVAGLLRSHAEILRSLHDLGVGADDSAGRSSLPMARVGSVGAAQDLTGVRPGGGALKLGVVGTGNDTLLAFLSSGCAACVDFWRVFDRPALDLPGVDTRLVVVTKGPSEESEAHVAGLAPEAVPVVMSTEAWHDYDVRMTPYFVLVEGTSGRVLGEGSANGWDQVRSLLDRAIGDAELAGRQAPRGFRAREADTDAELAAAGLQPGDPRLHHNGRGS